MISNLQKKSGWTNVLTPVFEYPALKSLEAFLESEKHAGKIIFPPENERFNAFNSTAFDDVKVVILGQDPYHGENQAHGLAFSVLPGNKIPPSLRNIYKELVTDVGFQAPDHGCLDDWARQGVLLMNAVMSVEQGKANSHQNRGWEVLTDYVIHALSQKSENLVFLLWGSYAQKKESLIDSSKHLILKAPHPSPLSAHRGFLGCRHFSQANGYLISHSKKPIDWQLETLSPQLTLY